MRRNILMLLAAVAFVAAVWRTVPGAINQQRYALEKRARAVAPAQRPAPVAAPAQDPAAAPVEPPRGARVAAEGSSPAGPIAGTIQALRGLKEQFRVFLVTHGMGGVWDVWLRVRAYLVDVRAWLWLAFFLLLEQLFPAAPLRRFFSPNRLLDFLYPVLSASLRTIVVLVAYNPIRTFYDQYLGFLHLRLLDDLPLFVQGLGAFLVLDFGHWLSHYIRHKVRWLWYFHAVHHSQTEMNPWTAFRAHPLEEVWNWALILIPAGLFGGDMAMWVVVTVLYGVIWPPFTHSSIRTNLGPFKYLIVSPQYHRVHHSNDPRQYDCNFGENLILWDWMFGTMWKDPDSYPDTGIPQGEFIEERSATPWGLVGAWVRQCAYPFIMIGRSIKGAVTGRS